MEGAAVWGIHGGKAGEADALFKERRCVALSWPDMGDVTLLPANRTAFRERAAAAYPNRNPASVTISAAQLFRFAHELEVGHIVVYPSKCDRMLHIGRVTGPLHYDPAELPEYPHRRSVDWLTVIPRAALTEGAMKEIGSALSLFRVKTHGREILSITGTHLPLVPFQTKRTNPRGNTKHGTTP